MRVGKSIIINVALYEFLKGSYFMKMIPALFILYMLVTTPARSQITESYNGELHNTLGVLSLAEGGLLVFAGTSALGNNATSDYAPTLLLMGGIDAAIGVILLRRAAKWQSNSIDQPYSGAAHKFFGISYLASGLILIGSTESLEGPGLVYVGLGAISSVVGLAIFIRGVQWKKYSLSVTSQGIGVTYRF